METLMVQAREHRGFNLRQVLTLDAVTCLAMGVVLVFGAAPMATLFGLPQALLFYAGVVLFPCAALMLFIARMQPPAMPLVWLIIGGNAAWVLASVAVALWFELTWIGLAFVVAQAAVVVVLMVLEWRALAARAE